MDGMYGSRGYNLLEHLTHASTSSSSTAARRIAARDVDFNETTAVIGALIARSLPFLKVLFSRLVLNHLYSPALAFHWLLPCSQRHKINALRIHIYVVLQNSLFKKPPSAGWGVAQYRTS